jgi:hypothetical protein
MQNSAASFDPLATRRLIQIPGPNPIVSRGAAGAWDEACIEAADILRDYTEGTETYYLYYHGVGRNPEQRAGSYQLGVATASQPLGPWEKAAQNPVLELGAEGDWDDHHVACACIIKEGPDRYLMWYSGLGKGDEAETWSIGLAFASHPLGPWEKHPGNPIIQDFGYVGGVVLVDGTYRLYTEYPISAISPDYGPFALATATDPCGPWRRHPTHPILTPPGWGAWDDGGYSEAKVAHRDGVFHLFYGGAKQHPMRIRSLESIGYAFSRDGVHFTPHVDNPVARREANPDASAFAEVKCLIEPPFVYLYHTLRYLSSEDPGIEDLGVQVLAMDTPFRLSMPLVRTARLPPAARTELSACPPLSLERLTDLAISVGGVCQGDAGAGLRLHLLASHDGIDYDTEAYHALDIACSPGARCRRTAPVPMGPMFVKAVVENLSPQGDATEVSVTATLGSS